MLKKNEQLEQKKQVIQKQEKEIKKLKDKL